MSPDEAVRLIAVARAAFPAMTVVEGMGQVWHGALGDLAYSECQTAIVAHSRENTRIVTVADIRQLVQGARIKAAGEERALELTARQGHGSQELVPMPDWFRTTMLEHRNRARAARKQAEEAGEPVSFGEAIVTALEMPRGSKW